MHNKQQLLYPIYVDPKINRQTNTGITNESYYTSEFGTRTNSGVSCTSKMFLTLQKGQEHF